MTRKEFLQELQRRGGYSQLEETPGPALKKLEADGFVKLAEYARCGFEMVRVDNVKITKAGELALASMERTAKPRPQRQKAPPVRARQRSEVMEYYALGPDGKTPFLLENGEYPDANQNRRVARDVMSDGKVVSTVFLNIDHRFGDGPPLLFETYVFPSEDDFCEIDGVRSSTWDEAERYHLAMVEKYTQSGD